MKWTNFSFFVSLAEAILSSTRTILVLILLHIVFSLHSGLLEASEILAQKLMASCMEKCTQHCATSWSAELGSRRTAKICPKHTCNQPRVNTQNICTHLCVSNCRFNVLSPVQNTHRGRQLQLGSKTPPKANHLQRSTSVVYKVVLAGTQRERGLCVCWLL